MSIRALTPYLFFNGTAEKAVRLYERALGAKTEAPSYATAITPNRRAPALPTSSNV